MKESILVSTNIEEDNSILPKKKKGDLRQRLVLLPHIFTLGNSFFGFCSIILSARGDLFAAASFILLGALMDSLDGRIARMVGITSDLGVQLDSLSDAISFCLAPALLVYCWQLKYLGFLGIVFCATFLLAGLFRLARFNLIHTKQSFYFLGLPTTIAGCFLSVVLLNFLNVEKNEWFLFSVVILVLLLSYLMVSSIHFPSFKKKLFNLNKNWYAVAFVAFIAIFYVLQLLQILLLLFLLYFLSALVFARLFKKIPEN